VPAAAANSAVLDAGSGSVARGNPALIVVPLEADGKSHLA